MPGQNFKVGKFNIKKELSRSANFHGSYYDRQALINLWDQFPFEDVTDRLLRRYINDSKDSVSPVPFTDWLRSNGRRITVREPFIRYKQTGKAETHFRLVRTVQVATPGLGQKDFEIILNTDIFKVGSRLRPEETWSHMVTVQQGPEAIGDGFRYKVRYITMDAGTHFPTQFLREGVRWMSAGSPNYSERSLDWGPVSYSTGHSVLVYQVPLFNASYEVELTDEAIEHTFTQKNRVESINYVYNIDVVDRPDLPKTTISDAELRIRAQAAMDREQDLIIGRMGLPIPDTSTGLFRKIGAGILNFLEDGHIYRYSPANFTIHEITDFLDTVWYNKLGTIEFWVGREALKLIDKAIRREYGEHTFIESFDDYVEKTGRVVPGGVEAWRLNRPMFNAYELQPWGVVEFKHAPFLDNRDFRGPKAPNGSPVMSYSMIANRAYGKGVESNIALVDREGFNIWAFHAGVVGPQGGIDDRKGGSYRATHSGRFGNIYHQSEYGVFVENINDFVWFMPNFR